MTQNQKVALVTGASGGIGREIALKLACDGFVVGVGYAGNQASANEVAKQIKAAGGKAITLQVDISSESSVERFFAQAQEHFTGVDVVVNSAAILEMAAITSANADVLTRTLDINVKGSWLVMAKAAECLQSGGRIIALSSSVIAKSFPGYGAYIASKSAVEGLVKVLANELRGRNLTVNAVAPGPIESEMFYAGKSEEQIKAITQMAPLERLGTAEEIANAVAFIAGEGGWVNGQILRVNGGFA